MCIRRPRGGAAPETLACVLSTAEACSTTEDGAEPLLCPSGYECHILSPGDVAEGIPNRGQCVKQRRQAGEYGCPSPAPSPCPNPTLPVTPHMGDPLQKKPLAPRAWPRAPPVLLLPFSSFQIFHPSWSPAHDTGPGVSRLSANPSSVTP